MKKKTISTDLNLPESLLTDDNHSEKIAMPKGIDKMPISSSPQYTLYRMLRHLKPASVLEIGTQSGYSALIMALAFRDNQMKVDITCVDPFLPSGDNNGFSTLAEWYNTINKSGFKSGIQLLLSTSEIILPYMNRQFDFVFVDGSHEYEHVRQDCLLSLNLLKEGGYFLVHDSTIYPSVKKGAEEVIHKFNLPYFVNDIQKNDRGDLCGWTITKKTTGLKSSMVSNALQEGYSRIESDILRRQCDSIPMGFVNRLFRRRK